MGQARRWSGAAGLRRFLLVLITALRLCFLLYAGFLGWNLWHEQGVGAAIITVVFIWWVYAIVFGFLDGIFSFSKKKAPVPDRANGPIAGSHTVEAMLFEGDPVKTWAARKARDKFF